MSPVFKSVKVVTESWLSVGFVMNWRVFVWSIEFCFIHLLNARISRLPVVIAGGGFCTFVMSSRFYGWTNGLSNLSYLPFLI